jgi:hypothetical protein
MAFRQKNFLYYGGRGTPPAEMPAVTAEARADLEREFDDWFEAHRRGRGCRVFFFPRGQRTWILVRHGQNMRREPSQSDDGASSTALFRPQVHDVLVYDRHTDEIGAHASTKGEIRLYLAGIGRQLFGDEGYFPPVDKFTLEPLLAFGSEALLCADIEGLEAVRIVELRRYWGGVQKEVEIRRASDLFAALGSRGASLDKGGRLVAATFKVKFSDAVKERSVTVRPPASATYERDDDSELIEEWLSRRGFLLNPQHPAEDDDEAPTAVLESA